MDRFKSLSCSKDFDKGEQKNHSKCENEKVFSPSKMDRFESSLPKYEELSFDLELFENNEAENLSLEHQQNSLSESVKENLQTAENYSNFSSMSTSNEITAFNSEPVSSNPLLKNTDFRYISTPKYVDIFSLYDLDDEELCSFSSNALMRILDAESDILIPDVHNDIDTVASTSHDRNDVPSLCSLSVSLNAENKANDDLNIRDNFSENDVPLMPRLIEDIDERISERTNTPTIMGKNRNCGFSPGQRDENGQTMFEKSTEPGNHFSSKIGSTASDERTSEIHERGGFVVSPNITERVAGSSRVTADTQYRMKDGRFVCSECGREFRRKGRFLLHYQYHTGHGRFSCDLCHGRFFSKCDMERHRLTHNK